MFTNASKVTINGGQFTNATTNNYSTGPTGIDILLEASTPEAAHDSSARDPPPRCFPGTREEFVEDIVQWAIPPVGRAPLPIHWMKGPAGVGKSAVAQTCVEKLKRQGKHCPAFFFSINGRNKYQKFFPSIAHQLATINSDYHDLVDRKIRRNKTLVNKTMETQFWGLLVEPLQELEERGKGIGDRIPVFVDGLDECESRDAQCEIIEIVASAARDGATPLCWAFFSRPEPHIEATFSKVAISPLCHMTILPISRDADGDIELYLRAGFENILRRLNIAMASPWPSDSDMKELVGAAGGLFIYAKTVLRFVGRPDSLNPDGLLRAIMAVISNHKQRGSAFAELDAFYMLIMQRIPARVFPIIHRLLATICWDGFSSAILTANILGISRVELEAACNHISAIVHFRRQRTALELDPTIDTSLSFLRPNLGLTAEIYHTTRSSLGGTISFYHKSFKDFLLDPLRSGNYYVKSRTMNEYFHERGDILARCFEGRHCWQGSELVRAPDAPDSAINLSYLYENELINSIIEVWIYRRTNAERLSPGADTDFRKALYVALKMSGTFFPGQERARTISYQCAGYRKDVRGTRLSWFQPGEFSKFDIASFKKEIENQQREDVIRPYNFTSPLLDKPKGRAESGLYVNGHGSKSIFWYWEIHYDLQTYRDFHAIDLDEGVRVFREEWSGSQVEG